MKYLGLFFYYILQFSWGIVQNLVGLAMFAASGKLKREFYHGALVSYHNGAWGGVSLGIFVFVNGTRDEDWIREAKVHEYGHTIQSLILGPLYLPVIGIPSFIWCNARRFNALREGGKVSYYDFYPESGANRLGALVTGEPIPSRDADIARAKERAASCAESEGAETRG